MDRVKCPYGSRYCEGFKCEMSIKGRCGIPETYSNLRTRLRELDYEKSVLTWNYADGLISEEKFKEESVKVEKEMNRLRKEEERYKGLMKHSGIAV